MRKTLILDNYDSFTYNLYQYLGELGGNPIVFRNDEISFADIKRMKPSHVVISPGPGRPDRKRDIGVCLEVIRKFAGPILGVCMGQQGIIYALGGKVVQAPEIMHGKVSQVKLDQASPLFNGLPAEITVMRYHSLIGERRGLPQELKVIAETEDAASVSGQVAKEVRVEKTGAVKDGAAGAKPLIMGVQHVSRPLFGVQFHPESIGTPEGKKILKNFLTLKK